MALKDNHICTCGDCEIDAFVDHCKYEVRAQQALEMVEVLHSQEMQAPTPEELLQFVLEGGDLLD